MLALLAPLFLLSVAGASALGALPFVVLTLFLSGLLYSLMYASFQRCLRQGEGHFAKYALSRPQTHTCVRTRYECSGFQWLGLVCPSTRCGPRRADKTAYLWQALVQW